ncbi:PAS domain-containing sensor histidine kinase [Fundidesulfovibrio butyratiphilus]
MKTADLKRLRLTMILTTIAFSLLPLLVLGIAITHEFSKAYKVNIEKNLLTLTEIKRDSIDQFLAERVAQLSLLANTEKLEDMSQPAYLEQIFSVIQAQSRSYIDLGVIGEDGSHLAYAGPYQLSEFNYKNEEWFAKVTAQGIYISDVFLGFRKHPHIIIAVLRREAGHNWILRATIDSEVFDALVRRIDLGRNGDAFLVNSKGQLQTTPRTGGQVMGEIALPMALNTRFDGVRVQDFGTDRQRALYAWSWMQKTDWLLVLRKDPTEELRTLFYTEHVVWILLAVGVGVICLGTVLVTNHMIRRLEKAEREKAALDATLTQSGKMAALGKMAAGVAHEINNPLAIIREQAGWIKDLLEEEDVRQSANFQEISEAADRIEHHVQRAKNVTQRMLGFARRMEPSTEVVDINNVLTETVKFLETEARHRNIDIVKHLCQQLPSVKTDPVQVQQVFLNLIDNAIDAIGKDGQLTLETVHLADSHQVEINVTDTGCGIEPDKLDKIFDPFFTTKKPGEGTGLGLAITFGIIEKLGGRITVHSQVGKGSTFTVRLPC